MTVSPGRVRVPWPLQVIFWCQFAELVAELVSVLAAAHGRPGWTKLAAWAAVVVLVVVLMLKLRAGRRWARWLLTVLAAIDLLLAVLRLLVGEIPSAAAVVGAAVTLVLLYVPPSNAFFRRATTAAGERV